MRRRRPSLALPFVCAAALAGALTATPKAARADNPAAAEALFLEARDLMAQKRYAEACPKLEASYALDRTVGTLMNVADCHENIGKIASAWGEWGSAYERLTREGDNRADYAAQRRDALAGRLPKLQITVTAPAASLDVYFDATKIEPGAYNVALPVDPGLHVITVRRGEEVLKQERVDVTEGATASTSLDLAAIEKSAPRSPPPPVYVAPPPRLPPPAPRSNSQKVAGFVLGGIGVGSVAIAGILELVAISNLSRADDPDACINNYCSPDGLDAVGRAQTFAEAGQWVGIGGILLAGVGLTLILTAPSPDAPPATRTGSPSRWIPNARIEPWVGPTGGGARITGNLW
jgi:hypothetical protein